MPKGIDELLTILDSLFWTYDRICLSILRLSALGSYDQTSTSALITRANALNAYFGSNTAKVMLRRRPAILNAKLERLFEVSDLLLHLGLDTVDIKIALLNAPEMTDITKENMLKVADLVKAEPRLQSLFNPLRRYPELLLCDPEKLEEALRNWNVRVSILRTAEPLMKRIPSQTVPATLLDMAVSQRYAELMALKNRPKQKRTSPPKSPPKTKSDPIAALQPEAMQPAKEKKADPHPAPVSSNIVNPAPEITQKQEPVKPRTTVPRSIVPATPKTARRLVPIKLPSTRPPPPTPEADTPTQPFVHDWEGIYKKILPILYKKWNEKKWNKFKANNPWVTDRKSKQVENLEILVQRYNLPKVFSSPTPRIRFLVRLAMRPDYRPILEVHPSILEFRLYAIVNILGLHLVDGVEFFRERPDLLTRTWENILSLPNRQDGLSGNDFIAKTQELRFRKHHLEAHGVNYMHTEEILRLLLECSRKDFLAKVQGVYGPPKFFQVIGHYR